MAGEEVVGGIVGFLRLDADDFHREITRAIAEVKVLKGMDAKVHVEAVGAAKMSRDLERVAKSADGTGRSVSGMNKSFGGLMSPQVIVGGLTAAVALLGPVTGAAAAATAGFVGVLGTGILAFQGFKKEVEANTALGQEMGRQLDVLQGNMQALSKTAATAMAGDVFAGLENLNNYLPSLNDDVATLSARLGSAFKISTTGLISGLENAMPLLQDGGKYAEILAQKFADFAQSQDFKDFIAYAQQRLPEVTDAFVSLGTGIKDLAVGLAPVGDDLIKIIEVLGKAASATGWFLGALEKLNDWTTPDALSSDKLMEQAQGQQTAATATETHVQAVANLAAIQTPLASGLGTTDAALAALAEKNRKSGDTAAQATLQMQLQGDAAGLLKQQLDLLNGKSLNVASAQTSAASATLGLTKSLKENGTTLSTNTAKGIENRQAIEAKVRADQALAEATAKATGSTKAGTESLKTSKGQLESTLQSQGRLTDKVQKYIDKLYAVPKNVPPTKLEVETSQGLAGIKAFQKAIDRLHGKTVTAQVRYAYSGKLPNGGTSTAGGQTFADGGTVRSKIPGYAGGTIVGPGSGRSDSILAGIAGTGELIRVSNGEHISTDASRRRNQAALEAGNNGATLGVVGGAAGGKTDLSDASLYRLAAIMRESPMQARVSPEAFDVAMGARL